MHKQNGERNTHIVLKNTEQRKRECERERERNTCAFSLQLVRERDVNGAPENNVMVLKTKVRRNLEGKIQMVTLTTIV